MKTIKVLSMLFLFGFANIALADKPIGGTCSMECPNGKNLSVSPCTTCEFHVDHITCDYENYYCP